MKQEDPCRVGGVESDQFEFRLQIARTVTAPLRQHHSLRYPKRFVSRGNRAQKLGAYNSRNHVV